MTPGGPRARVRLRANSGVLGDEILLRIYVNFTRIVNVFTLAHTM